MSPTFRVQHLIFSIVAMLVTLPLLANDFPPITDEQRNLEQVDWIPSAPAVVLFEKAELEVSPPAGVTTLRIQVRIKILKEEGKQYAETQISHSSLARLRDLEGRTILPNGQVIPLTPDYIFREKRSRADRFFVTKISFPAVTAGAIIDYRYNLKGATPYIGEPWYFNNYHIPTLLSEFAFFKPKNRVIQTWDTLTSSKSSLEIETKKSQRGNRIQARMVNLPPIPKEPNTFPFADLSSAYMWITREWPIRQDPWRELCDYAENWIYSRPRANNSQARRRAKEIVAQIDDDQEKIAKLFVFVRDEILVTSRGWVLNVTQAGVDRVLTRRQGTVADKALLLQTMLEAVEIESKLVWASDREAGRVDPSVANSWWFERVFVTVDLDNGRFFLDPSDRRLGFGRLAARYEGTRALLHQRKPEIIKLPEAPFDQNTRRARIKLELDSQGRASGNGQLVLRGHHAHPYLRWKNGKEETVEAWKERLISLFGSYDINEVTATESIDEQQVLVTWSLTQRSDESLGDEVSLTPNLPLGPLEQPFALPAHLRLTPVQLSFADRDEVELSVEWPGSWEIDVLPEATIFRNKAGELTSSIEVDTANRHLTYKRRFDIHHREFIGQEYAEIRSLYSEVENHDAQSLVLIRR